MKLKVTYQRSSGRPADVVITTDATATVGDIARELLDADPLPTDRRRFAGDVTLGVAPPNGGRQVRLPGDRAVGEAAVASGCEVSVVEAPEPNRKPAERAAALLEIVGGPDAGREFHLAAGSSTIGRDPAVEVALSDGFVSKRHARVDITQAGIEVVDLNSANGILVDGVVETRLKLLAGQTFVLGDSHLAITLLSAAGPPTSASVEGGAVGFNRSPRVEARYAQREHPRPAVPTEPTYQPFPWIMLIAPLAMAAAMYFFIGPRALIFALLAPIMLFGNHVMSRGRTRREHELAVEKFETQLAALRATLAHRTAAEQVLRQAELPSVADTYRASLDRTELLWTRRPEHWSFLHLRLGVGRLPSRNTIARPSGIDDGIPEFSDKLRLLEEEFGHVAGVPVIESLQLAGSIGVIGGRVEVGDAVRGLLVQLTGTHSPAELIVTALADPTETEQLGWLAWLPHTSSPQSPITGSHLADSASSASQLIAQLEELVQARLGRRSSAPPRGPLAGALTANGTGGRLDDDGARGPSEADAPQPSIVVLVTQDAPGDRARLVQLAEKAAEAGVFPIWTARSRSGLPAVTRTFLDVTAGLHTAAAHFVRHGAVVPGVQVEGVSLDHARRFAVALAPVVDTGALVEDASDLPRHVPILTLLGEDLAATSSAIVDRWHQNQSIHQRGTAPSRRRRPGTLRALVGHAGADAMHLDLRSQGPHALVGGTTGSGKSEFLQAWVLGMAAEYSPDRATFLFVDYKGGSAFAECVKLPHCVGLVTDLSPHLVRRALTSLRAELHHREHLLNRKEAKDLLELEKRGDPESPPALILVIDEFAALVNEVPEFVDGVVDIAQRGRSLGIHLIMATQRPAGVIRDNLRANTNLRVALRMADEADSSDVIGSPDAAYFDTSIPGRGIVKTGPGRLMPFQSAYAGGRSSADAVKPTIALHPLGFGAGQPWERPDKGAHDLPDDTGPSDLERLVASIGKASTLADIPPPRRPWLDELAPTRDLKLMTSSGPRTDSELILGTADLPTEQSQETVSFRPDVDGNLAVYGTSGSGKSVLLRTLAVAAGVTPRGGPVHVYCLDFAAGGLRMLEPLPHVGAVIKGDDSERVVRLLRTLRDLAQRRAQDYPAVNAGTVAEYRELAKQPDEPRILLLVDGFPAFREQWEVGSGRAEWYAAFQQLLTEGRALGIHVVFTADRPGSVPGSVASSVPRRVVLRLADEGMYAVLGVEDDILDAKSPPGRAIVDGAETQIAIMGGSANVADQSDAINKLARAMARRATKPAPPIEALPTEYSLTTLPSQVAGQPALGLSDLDLSPVGFDPTGTIVVSGGPQSGRSTALAALAASLRRWDPDIYAVYLGNKRSTLPSVIDWDEVLTAPQEVAERARELAGKIGEITADKYVIVIEGLSDFSSMPTDSAIADLVKAVKRSDHLIIAESESHTWTSSFPIYGEMKSSRRGLLLQPESHEGDSILRTATPRVARSEFPPGRGFWIAGGKAVRVQIPLP